MKKKIMLKVFSVIFMALAFASLLLAVYYHEPGALIDMDVFIKAPAAVFSVIWCILSVILWKRTKRRK